jgi:tRNA(Ile)-lysidine synthase
MPPWFPKLVRALEAYPPGKRYLVGVSGGRDSVALLHLLVQLGYGKLVVCHFNHCLRGRSSDADERFVCRLAEKLGLRFVSAREDVAGMAATMRLSLETAGRHARYAFFEKVARQTRCHAIFLAHHADDRVETFLFNLFRGAGPAGLGGMRPESQRGKLLVLRPLLGVWREQIDEFIRENRLKFREDATNAELQATRNRMRHRIVPFLEEEFGRQVRGAIWRTAEIIAAEEEWIGGQVAKVPVAGAELSVRELRQMPEALQRRAIHAWLKAHGIVDVGFEEVETVRSLLPESAKAAKVNLPGDRHARRRAGKLFLE